MLDQLRQIAIFAKTIECGSFSKAASVLNLSPSVVSHHISQLEKQLGVALIYRSTRKLSLTSQGEKLLASAQAMTRAGEQFVNHAVENNAQLTGSLNITLPAFMADSILFKHISDFVKINKHVSVSIDFSDSQRELIADGIDLAIRIGTLRDSNLKARKLFEMERCVVASKEIVDNLPARPSPKDLENEAWVGFSVVGLRYAFKNKVGKRITIHPNSRTNVNNINAVKKLVKNGNGIGVLPTFVIKKGEKGAFVQLIKDWQLAPLGVYALSPANTPKDALSKKLIEYLLSFVAAK